MNFVASTGDPILFWVLRLVVLLSLYLSGYLISYRDENGKNYWKYSSIGVIVYSLVEGLRWNRGVDYPHYYQDITGKLYQDYSEVVYLWWTDIFKFSGLPFWIGFIFYSFLLIWGFYFLIKKFRKQAVWALPLFFIITVGSSENLIRQFLAVAMFEFSLFYLWEKKLWKCAIFAILTLQIHNSVIIMVMGALFIQCVHFDKKIKSGYLMIAIYLFFYYFWNPSFLTPITSWLSTISVNDSSRVSMYLDNADFWFSEASSLSDRLGFVSKAASIFSKMVSLVTTCLVIKYGFDLTKQQERYRIAYWFSYLSYILYVFSNNGDFEIWFRLSVMFNLLIPLVVAGIMTNLSLRTVEKYIVYSFFGVYFLYNSFFSMWGQSILGSAFVWDR